MYVFLNTDSTQASLLVSRSLSARSLSAPAQSPCNYLSGVANTLCSALPSESPSLPSQHWVLSPRLRAQVTVNFLDSFAKSSTRDALCIPISVAGLSLCLCYSIYLCFFFLNMLATCPVHTRINHKMCFSYCSIQATQTLQILWRIGLSLWTHSFLPFLSVFLFLDFFFPIFILWRIYFFSAKGKTTQCWQALPS